MKKLINLFVCFLVTSGAAAQKQKQENIDVSFPSNSAQLTPDITADLDHLYSELAPRGWIRLNITGQISKKGGNRHRNMVASKRAEAVRDYFLMKGIPANNIYINKSFNSKRKYVTAAHSGSRSSEHLYEVRVYKPASGRPVEYTQSAIEEIAAKQEECYVIDPLREDSLQALQGTVLRFQPLSFEFLNGEEVREEVVICIREYYSIPDIVMNDLATISNKRMLETGGMLYVTATCKGYEVRIKRSKSYVIRMPARQVLPRMKLFTGEEKGGIVDWKETNIRNVPTVTTVAPTPVSDPEVGEEGEGFDRVTYGDQNSSEEQSEADYVFNATGFGWINCDRFPPASPKTNLIVKLDSASKVSVRLVFKNIRSVMPAYYETNNTVRFDYIPIGEKASLVAYEVGTDKQLYVAAKDITISKDNIESLQLVPISINAFKDYLKTLDR